MRPFRRMRGDAPGHPFRGNQYTRDRRASDAEVLRAVTLLWAHAGRPPTLRELAAAVGFRAPASLLPHLDRLEAAGLVDREGPAGPGANRAVWPAGLRAHVRAWPPPKNS